MSLSQMPKSRHCLTTGAPSGLAAGSVARSAGRWIFVMAAAAALSTGGPGAFGARAAGAQETTARALAFEPFSQDAFDAAVRGKRPFVLYFWAKWCEPCDKMKSRTYTDEDVLEAAAGLRLLSVDMTRRRGYVGLVLKSFNVIGAPTTIFFGPDGKEWQRRIGYIPPDVYARLLRESRKPEERSQASGSP